LYNNIHLTEEIKKPILKSDGLWILLRNILNFISDLSGSGKNCRRWNWHLVFISFSVN